MGNDGSKCFARGHTNDNDDIDSLANRCGIAQPATAYAYWTTSRARRTALQVGAQRHHNMHGCSLPGYYRP